MSSSFPLRWSSQTACSLPVPSTAILGCETAAGESSTRTLTENPGVMACVLVQKIEGRARTPDITASATTNPDRRPRSATASPMGMRRPEPRARSLRPRRCPPQRTVGTSRILVDAGREREVAGHARDFVEVLVLGKEVAVRCTGESDADGRARAVVHWRDAEGSWSNLNADLVENGLAAWEDGEEQGTEHAESSGRESDERPQ